MNDFDRHIEKLECSNHDLHKENDSIKADVTHMQQTINRMNEKIQKGEGENRTSIVMANHNEQYARSHSIRI